MCASYCGRRLSDANFACSTPKRTLHASTACMCSVRADCTCVRCNYVVQQYTCAVDCMHGSHRDALTNKKCDIWYSSIPRLLVEHGPGFDGWHHVCGSVLSDFNSPFTFIFNASSPEALLTQVLGLMNSLLH